MNRDSRGEILILALILSIGVHVGMMFYAKPRVMTHVVSSSLVTSHRGPMRVTRATDAPPPVKIDSVQDVDALKDAPQAEALPDVPVAPAATGRPEVKTIVPAALSDVPNLPKPDLAQPKLDVKVLSSAHSEEKLVLAPETPGKPTQSSLAVSAPDVLASSPVLPGPAGRLATAPAPKIEPLSEPEKILPTEKKDEETKAFKPEEEVREKVDEQMVKREREAVKDLLDVSRAEELKPLVHVAMTSCPQGPWTYFKVMVSPRKDLPVISKDVVLVLDASGSIGKDRIKSVREAAKTLLRTCTNSGDRFNLVAFRDRYSYAFRRWQTCSQSSFDAADAWLDQLAAHGRTDVFDTIRSVLTLPRDPVRPLIALVVTDGEANAGVSETAEIISRFTALNDGLISVYMYGVKGSANRELIDVLTHGNRGESFIYDGWRRWAAGSGIEGLGERFRDPVLSDIRILFASDTKAESFPRLLKNLYRGETLSIVGRVPSGTKSVAFSVRGLNGSAPYESFIRLDLNQVGVDESLRDAFIAEQKLDLKLR